MLTARLGSTQLISRLSGFQTWFVLTPTYFCSSASPSPSTGWGGGLAGLIASHCLVSLLFSASEFPLTWRTSCNWWVRVHRRYSPVPNSLTPTCVCSSPLSRSPPRHPVIGCIHRWPLPPPPSTQNNDNETPLHCAAQYGHTGVVRLLLEELTDPTMRNNKFETPLDLAALYGRLEVVKLLLSAHPNLLNCNTKKHTPLHLASRNGHLPVVEVLLDAGMDINYEVRNRFRSVCLQPNGVDLKCEDARGADSPLSVFFSFVLSLSL